MCYNLSADRGVAQLVEHWSPKPGVASSSLAAPAKKEPFGSFFVGSSTIQQSLILFQDDIVDNVAARPD